MRKRKFYALKQSWYRWLTTTVLLIAIAVLGSGCSSGGDEAPPYIPPSPSTVETTRDDKGVWFITGSEQDSIYDIFEAAGYAVASDRLWQAETFRRSARGRLAEIFGESQLSQDTFIRTTGYSDQELEVGFASLYAEERDVINGYVAGFNRRIAEIRANPDLLPFEFSAVGITSVTLENWTYKDVLAWAAVMSRNFDPGAHRTGQLENAALYQTLVTVYGATTGTRMFEDLRWLDDPDALTYIPKPIAVPLSVGLEGKTEETLTPLMKAPPAFPDLREVARRLADQRTEIDENLKKINAYVKMGSYAWAISGSKTATGNPMIYSGPQMGFTVPSIIGEGSIRAGGLNISGMHIAGLPGIVIGRTPHHAWSMQVGHAHTVDYYLESPADVSLHRTETIKVAGGADVVLPVYRTARGPVVNASPPISWKYSHWGHEFKFVRAYLGLARATSMDEFGASIELVPVSQHFTYADRDGNIAFWMSGRDPVRPYGEWRLPQGAAAAPLEWDSANLIPRTTDRNNGKGYYCGWNNKARANYPNPWNNSGYSFGTFHRAHVLEDYLSVNDNLTFDQVRQLALNIATTDSFGGGGNPWKFVSAYFIAAVNAAPDAPVAGRTAALDLLAAWDGHFVDGDWATGTTRADAWILMDAWIREVIELTFEELDVFPAAKNNLVLFNVLLHALRPGGIDNYYNWFQNAAPAEPQTADAIIVEALDNTLAALGARPWGTGERGVIPYNHVMLGNVRNMPFSSRSTYAHVVEYGSTGPVNIKSMFPLGESGTILAGPVFDANFFTMTPVYDNFVYRDFPLFTP
jgi:penicillin amidase